MKRVLDDAPRPVLTVAEVADRWGVNAKTIYEAIRLGQLPAVRLGRRGIIRVPRAVVESVEQGRVVPHGGNHDDAT